MPDDTRGGWAASRLGLGCVTFGREIDATAASAMMDHAAAYGISTFDTAAAYAQGASERVVGDWLAAHRAERAKLTIVTKLLPPYSADRIEAGVAASLARLRADHIDLLFLHQWHESALEEPGLKAFDALVRTGRIRALGASNFTASQLNETLTRQAQLGCTPISVLQNVHNYAVSGFGAKVRSLCARHGVGLMGYSPLGAGFLTGKHRDGVEPGSRFALIPGHQAIYFTDAARARQARLAAVAAEHGLAVTRLALAWALSDAAVQTTLVGGRTPSQLDQALAAADSVEPAILARLNDA